MEVAQAALALLDVGLDQVAGGALLAMALVALGKLGGDEGRAGSLDHLGVEAGDQRIVEGAIAPDVARLEHRGADGHVGAGEPDALVDAARGVADRQAEVPEQVEDELHDALAPGRLLVGEQEEEIDIGAGRQRAAAIAADGDHRHALGGARVVGPVDVIGGKAVDRLDDAVLEVGQATGAGGALAVGLQPLLGGGAAFGQRRLQLGEDSGTGLCRQRPRLAGQFNQPVAQGFAIDHGIGSGNRFVHGARQ